MAKPLTSWWRNTGGNILKEPTFLLFFLNFLCGSAGKESTCNVEDLGSIPGLERPPGEGKGYPLQYSGLENSMDYIVHGVTKSWIQLSNFQKKMLLMFIHVVTCVTDPFLFVAE